MSDNDEREIVLTNEERRRILAWAAVCSGESMLYEEDEPLLAKLGGRFGPGEQVIDTLHPGPLLDRQPKIVPL